MAQLAVAWVLQNDNIASAITGGSRPEQVHDNAAAAGKKLSAETLAGIDEALGDVVELRRLQGRRGLADVAADLSRGRSQHGRPVALDRRPGPG